MHPRRKLIVWPVPRILCLASEVPSANARRVGLRSGLKNLDGHAWSVSPAQRANTKAPWGISHARRVLRASTHHQRHTQAVIHAQIISTRIYRSQLLVTVAPPMLAVRVIASCVGAIQAMRVMG